MLKTISVVMAIVIFYVGFILYSDFDNVVQSFSQFRFEFLLPVFGLFFLATVVKGIRQHILLKSVSISIPVKKSILLHMAGLTMALTPGGSGELIKSYYLKNKFGYNISQSFPTVIVEKFYDLLGVTTLVVFSLYYIKIIDVTIVIFFISGLVFIIYFIINSKSFFKMISKIFSKIPFLKKYILSIEESYEFFQTLTSTRNLIKNWFLSVFSFLIYAVGFYFVFLGFNVDLNIIFTTFVTFSSILFGALTFLPQGIGVTEISVVTFLINEGITLSLATSIMVMLRLTSMWFLITLGFITTKLFLK